MKFIKFIIIGVLILCFDYAHSQDVVMSNGTVTTCGGQFFDDGLGGPYSDQSYTFTICPDTPGDVIQVDFAAFSLYTNLNPNNSDGLLIYDGDNTSVPSPSYYSGTGGAGISVTGTVNNTSGCLTFVFNPSNSSDGTFPGWEGLISCTTPCDPPTGASTIIDPVPDENNSVSVCLDTPITFADNGSAPGVGFSIENYIWHFDDGSTEEGANLSQVEHSFTEPGEYIVTLTVEDNNGCQNTNLIPLQVLVSTIPVFHTEFTSEVCLGGSGYVDGNPVQSQTWTALPPQVVAGETYLADGDGFSYTSSLVFDFFEDGQTLQSIDDLYDVSVNMEHSYMGDLQIQLSCPDGSSVVLVEFPNAGGGTFLGEALDDISTDPGIGYDYSWDPDATNGTWSENAAGVDILPAGAYESEYDLSELVGCPLNGEWNLEVIDNLGADNGYIFEWGVNLNPELFPGVTTYTPVIGLGPDSTYVEGDFIDFTTVDGNYIDITPPTLGEHEYTFYATNNFGCTFDTTLVVSVVNGPVVDAGIDLEVCNDPLMLDPSIVSNDFIPAPCTFSFILSNDDTDFGDASIDVSLNGVFTQTFSSFAPEQIFELEIQSGSTLSIDYTFSDWNGEVLGNEITVLNDSGDTVFESGVSPNEGEIFNDIVLCAGEGQIQYEWSPAEFLDNPNSPNPFATVTETTQFTVTAYPMGHEGCSSTDVMTIEVNPAGDPGISSAVELCAGLGNFDLIDYLEGTPVAFGDWTDQNGNPVNNTLNSLDAVTGVYTYTVGVNDCLLSSELDISLFDPVSMTISESQELCMSEGTEISVTSLNEGQGQQSFTWSNSSGVIGTDQTLTINPTTSDQYCAEYVDLCPGETVVECLNITVEEAPVISIFSSSVSGCEPHTVQFENLTDTTAYELAVWDIGDGFYNELEPFEHIYYEPGLYDVTLSLESSAGCSYSETFPNYMQVFASPEPSFTYTPFETEIPETEIDFVNLTEGIIIEQQWVFDTLNVLGVSTEIEPTFTFPIGQGGVYPVSLTVTDFNECESTAVYPVTINDPLNVFIPTAFTPNGDGLNDVLFFTGTDINADKFHVEVFNRWGEVVYESNDLDAPWDGSHAGGEYYVEEGIYNYVIEVFSLSTTKRIEIQGHVSVVR